MKKSLILSAFLLSFCFVIGQNATGVSEDIALKDLIESPARADMTEFSSVDNEHINAENIQHLATRNLYEIAALISTEVERSPSGDGLYMRGLPAQVYVDGVKIRGPLGLPQKAIKEVRVISGSSASF